MILLTVILVGFCCAFTCVELYYTYKTSKYNKKIKKNLYAGAKFHIHVYSTNPWTDVQTKEYEILEIKKNKYNEKWIKYKVVSTGKYNYEDIKEEPLDHFMISNPNIKIGPIKNNNI